MFEKNANTFYKGIVNITYKIGSVFSITKETTERWSLTTDILEWYGVAFRHRVVRRRNVSIFACQHKRY